PRAPRRAGLPHDRRRLRRLRRGPDPHGPDRAHHERAGERVPTAHRPRTGCVRHAPRGRRPGAARLISGGGPPCRLLAPIFIPTFSNPLTATKPQPHSPRSGGGRRGYETCTDIPGRSVLPGERIEISGVTCDHGQALLPLPGGPGPALAADADLPVR